jgi:hypothetical protein
MTEPIAAASAPEQSLFARAVGILTSPRRTFEGVVAHPRPVGILFLVALVVALATGLPQLTDRGRQAVLDMQVQQFEKFTGQPVTDAMYASLEQRSHYSAYITMVGSFVGMPILMLIISTIYWAVFNIALGGTAAYKQVLAIATHSSVIRGLGLALGAPIQYLKGTMTSTGPFNLGTLVPMLDEKSFVSQFLSFIDPFGIWGILVVSIGLGVLYKRKTAGIAITLFTLYGLIACGYAAYMSR